LQELPCDGAQALAINQAKERPGMPSIEEIAAKFRAATDFGASLDIMRLNLAQDVRADHVPPEPGDGVVARDLIVTYTGYEKEAVMRALPNGRLANEVTIDGDWLIVQGRLQGALADGSIIDMPSQGAYQVSGGEIVAIRSTMDSSGVEMFKRLLKEGGFNPPWLQQPNS
jgi:hypothetical protein